ncbi:MAG: hypothetical protein ACR2GW_12235 [Pyrinomonadaceae bacterium]
MDAVRFHIDVMASLFVPNIRPRMSPNDFIRRVKEIHDAFDRV